MLRKKQSRTFFRRSSSIDKELESPVAIWQKIVRAQLLWIAEVVERLGVTVPINPADRNLYVVKIDAPIEGENSDQAVIELGQMLDSIELLYWNISLTHGDPHRRGIIYRKSADLWGREPLQALVDEALTCIDVALIGPLDHAAALLASDERLYASAKTRELYSTPTEAWTPRVREILARADSIFAKRAIDGVLHAR
jgi:hypothetical protein